MSTDSVATRIFTVATHQQRVADPESRTRASTFGNILGDSDEQ
jgi:hypothetical protein